MSENRRGDFLTHAISLAHAALIITADSSDKVIGTVATPFASFEEEESAASATVIAVITDDIVAVDPTLLSAVNALLLIG